MTVNFNLPKFAGKVGKGVAKGVSKVPKGVTKVALLAALAVGADLGISAIRTNADRANERGYFNSLSFWDNMQIHNTPLVVQAGWGIDNVIETRSDLKKYGMNPNKYIIGKRVEAKNAIDSAKTMQYCLEHGVKPTSNEYAHYLSDSLRAEAVGIPPYKLGADESTVSHTQWATTCAEIDKILNNYNK